MWRGSAEVNERAEREREIVEIRRQREGKGGKEEGGMKG